MPFAPSYDTVGWFARDAGVLAHVGAAILPRRDTPPIIRLLLARDAFALCRARSDAAVADGPLEDWDISGELTIFELEEESWRECYRVLQGRGSLAEPGCVDRQPRTPRFGENHRGALRRRSGDHAGPSRPLSTGARQISRARLRERRAAGHGARHPDRLGAALPRCASGRGRSPSSIVGP